MPRHTKQTDRAVPRLAPGGTSSYQAPLMGFQVGRSANEWIAIAKETDELTKSLGEAFIAREEANNEAAQRAGTLAAIQQKTKEGLGEHKGVYAAGHARAAYDLTSGKRKSHEFDSQRRRAASLFGQDPNSTAEMWATEEKTLKDKFIEDNEITTELGLLGFQGGLDAHASQHWNIFRAANTAAISYKRIEDITAEVATGVSKIFFGNSEVNMTPPAGLPDGTPATDPDGNVVSSGSGPVIVSTENVITESARRELLHPNLSLAEKGRMITAYVEANTENTTPEERRQVWQNTRLSLEQEGWDLYMDALQRLDMSAAGHRHDSLQQIYDMLLEHMNKADGKTSIFNAKTITGVQKAKTELTKDHDNNLLAIQQSQILHGDKLTLLLSSHLYKEDGKLKAEMTFEEIRNAIPGLVEEQNLLPATLRDNEAIYSIAAQRLLHLARTEAAYQAQKAGEDLKVAREFLVETQAVNATVSRTAILNATPDHLLAEVGKLATLRREGLITELVHTELSQLIESRMDAKTFVTTHPKVSAVNTSLMNMAKIPLEEHHAKLEKDHNLALYDDPANRQHWDRFFAKGKDGKAPEYLKSEYAKDRKDVRDDITTDMIDTVFKLSADQGVSKKFDVTRLPALSKGEMTTLLSTRISVPLLEEEIKRAISEAILAAVKNLPEENAWGLDNDLRAIDFDDPAQTKMSAFIDHLLQQNEKGERALSIASIVTRIRGNDGWTPGDVLNLSPFEHALPSDKPLKQTIDGQVPTDQKTLLDDFVKEDKKPTDHPSADQPQTPLSLSDGAMTGFRDGAIIVAQKAADLLDQAGKEVSAAVHHYSTGEEASGNEALRRAYDLTENARMLKALADGESGLVPQARGNNNASIQLFMLLQQQIFEKNGAIDSSGNINSSHEKAPAFAALARWLDAGVGASVVPTEVIQSRWGWWNSALYGNESNMKQSTPAENAERVGEDWQELFVWDEDQESWQVIEDPTISAENKLAKAFEWFRNNELDWRPEVLADNMVLLYQRQLEFAKQEKFVITPSRGVPFPEDSEGWRNITRNTAVKGIPSAYPSWIQERNTLGYGGMLAKNFALMQREQDAETIADFQLNPELVGADYVPEDISYLEKALGPIASELRRVQDASGTAIPLYFLPMALATHRHTMTEAQIYNALEALPELMRKRIFVNYKQGPDQDRTDDVHKATFKPSWQILAARNLLLNDYREYLEELGELHDDPPLKSPRTGAPVDRKHGGRRRPPSLSRGAGSLREEWTPNPAYAMPKGPILDSIYTKPPRVESPPAAAPITPEETKPAKSNEPDAPDAPSDSLRNYKRLQFHKSPDYEPERDIDSPTALSRLVGYLKKRMLPKTKPAKSNEPNK